MHVASARGRRFLVPRFSFLDAEGSRTARNQKPDARNLCAEPNTFSAARRVVATGEIA
jgi:hypothetical protein